MRRERRFFLSLCAKVNRYAILVDGSFHLAFRVARLLQHEMLCLLDLRRHFPAGDFIQVFQQKQRHPGTAVIGHFDTPLGTGERAAKH